MKLKEKDKLIDDLRRSLDEAKRKSEQGSQQRQDEVLEIDVETELARRFPHDLVAPVAKGARGADLIHEVRDQTMRACGTIVWETKNTRHWHTGWLDKLKDDQRAIGANLAVIVATALPDGIVEFGRIERVWVASLRAWPALALALREQLSQVAFAQTAAEGKHEKMEFLYRHLVNRHKGELIYAGGDDVLVLVPTETAIACAEEIQRAFRGIYSDRTPGYFFENGHDLLGDGAVRDAFCWDRCGPKKRD